MAINSSALKFPVSIFLWLTLTIFSSPVFAQDFINYLPRSEDMDSTVQDYPNSQHPQPLVITSVNCANKSKVFQDAANCYRCVQEWLPHCNQCCFKSGHLAPCTPETSCFDIDGCKCATMVGDPVAGATAKCQKMNDGLWYCDKDKLLPGKNCFDNLEESLKNSNECDVNNFYVVKEVDTTPPVPPKVQECPKSIKPDPATRCYKYTLDPQVHDCIDKCKIKEGSFNTYKGCRSGYCPSSKCLDSKDPRTCGDGYYDVVCNRASCKEIEKNNAFCNYSTTSKKCVGFTNEGIDCLASGQCTACFKEIDPDFNYRFVAKSRESITLIWQIGCNPSTDFKGDTAPAYFLYSKVKIYDAADPSNVVWESVIHQKYLGAAFSIFCATHIPKEKLTQGRAYFARIFYYLPEADPAAGVNLEVTINNLRLILVRVRE